MVSSFAKYWNRSAQPYWYSIGPWQADIIKRACRRAFLAGRKSKSQDKGRE